MKDYIPENETLERMAKRIAKPLRGASEMVSGLSLPALPEKVQVQKHLNTNVTPSLHLAKLSI